MTEKRPPASANVQVDNPRVLITEYRFAPGAETGWHRHALDYVVVPMTTGTLRLESSDGVREAELTSGQSYSRDAGVEHNVVNVSEHDFVFVEIEIKS